MYIYYPAHIKAIEQITCKEQSISHLQLIQRAGAGFVENFLQFVYKNALPVIVLAGKGNNGADAIEISNLLAARGLDVTLYLIFLTNKGSEEFNSLSTQIYHSVQCISVEEQQLQDIEIFPDCYLIDGIFGAGLSRALPESIDWFITRLNQIHNKKVAIDIPTGLQCDGTVETNALICNYTIALGTLKPAYFFHYPEDYIGTLLYTEIGLSRNFSAVSNGVLLDKSYIQHRIKQVPRISHKYQRGSALLIGGQYGTVGCMRLAGESALRSGCGIVTLHVPKCAVEFLQGSLPEALIEPDENFYSVGLMQNYEKFQSIGIGPGMGRQVKQNELVKQILMNPPAVPLVWDADALRILGDNPDFLNLIPPLSILTPHAGEFAALFNKKLYGKDLHEFALLMANQFQLIILFKGADTIIYAPDNRYYVNSTGNCGMATAGSGDVLTGIITGLLAQGYSPLDAACLGAYFHGLAGDLAAEQLGHNSLIASDIIRFLGNAFIQFNEK